MGKCSYDSTLLLKGPAFLLRFDVFFLLLRFLVAFSVKSVSMLMKSLHVNHMGLYMSTSVKQINRAFISFRQVIWVIFLTLGKLKVSNTVALLTLGKSQMFFLLVLGRSCIFPHGKARTFLRYLWSINLIWRKGLNEINCI